MNPVAFLGCCVYSIDMHGKYMVNVYPESPLQNQTGGHIKRMNDWVLFLIIAHLPQFSLHLHLRRGANMNNISLLFDLSSVFRVCLTAYCGLLIYNFISAVLGLCLLRRFYVGLLRRLYRVRRKPRQSTINYALQYTCKDTYTQLQAIMIPCGVCMEGGVSHISLLHVN